MLCTNIDILQFSAWHSAVEIFMEVFCAVFSEIRFVIGKKPFLRLILVKNKNAAGKFAFLTMINEFSLRRIISLCSAIKFIDILLIMKMSARKSSTRFVGRFNLFAWWSKVETCCLVSLNGSKQDCEAVVTNDDSFLFTVLPWVTRYQVNKAVN